MTVREIVFSGHSDTVDEKDAIAVVEYYIKERTGKTVTIDLMKHVNHGSIFVAPAYVQQVMKLKQAYEHACFWLRNNKFNDSNDI